MIIIIAGIPRSGKSTVAKTISEAHNYSYIPFDSFVSTFNKLYPNLGITHYDNYKVVSKRVAPFLKELIKHINYEDISVVIDIYQLTPDDVRKYELDKISKIIYFGYTEISLEDKYNFIRKYSRSSDWTESLSEEELKAIIQEYIDESIEVKKKCEEYNIPFIDTGKDFKKTIKEAINYFA
jgi:broad-specificity NMP kinase